MSGPRYNEDWAQLWPDAHLKNGSLRGIPENNDEDNAVAQYVMPALIRIQQPVGCHVRCIMYAMEKLMHVKHPASRGNADCRKQ